MPTLGFQAKAEVDDAGTGAEAAGAFTALAGVLTFALPPEEVGEAEVTELGQKLPDGTTPDKVRRFMPTLEDPGLFKCEGHFTKTEYVRLRALKGKVKNWKLYSPDEDAGAPTVQIVAEGAGFVKKIEEVKFIKDEPMKVAFEVRRTKAWTYA